VSPIVAVLLGSAVFGEHLSVPETLGMGAMLIGAWLSLMPSKAKAAPIAMSRPVMRAKQ
jgi:drug/metabolite transporter (DMT)-like permease